MPNCPKCQAPMQKGFIFDRSYGKSFPVAWIEGAPKYNWLEGFFVPKGRKRHYISAFRCPLCGVVELYTPADLVIEE
jgi:hypothetical protein